MKKINLNKKVIHFPIGIEYTNGQIFSNHIIVNGKYIPCWYDYENKIVWPDTVAPKLKAKEFQAFPDNFETYDFLNYDEIMSIFEKPIDKILYKCDCRSGAPMGRCDIGTRPTNQRIYDCKVSLCSQGYDKGGAYWGFGGELRVSYTKDLSYIEFYRK